MWFKRYVTPVLIGVFLGLILNYIIAGVKFLHGIPKSGVDTVRIVEFRYDTLPQDTVKIRIPEVRYEVNVRDSIIIDTVNVLANLKIRDYKKYFSDDWARIEADIKVYGTLLDANIQYVNLKPQILKTEKVQTTITKYVGGIYLGAFVGSGTADVELNYINRTGWMYGYKYNIVRNSHAIGVSKKIFGR